MSNGNLGIIERKARIFNIQKYNMYDGDGIRTLVFFQGCPLRCKWCANPEGLEKKYRVMLKSNLCVNCGACVSACPVGIHIISNKTLKHEVNRDIDCIGCGKCKEACLKSAISIVGEEKTISELLKIVEEDRTFYEMSGGGVTLGGGEVLMQPEAATSLLMACKQEGINTAIETCGYTKLETILKVAEFVDLFLFDIKNINSDRHHELTGVRNERILENLQELLKKKYNVKIRMPLLKGINDSQDEIEKTMEFLLPYKDYKNFKGIDLLPYHKMGVNKYNQLGMEYPIKDDPSLKSEDLDRIEGWIKKYDLPVKVIRH
ncbi:choline TMA-lyase-activating enzyme [Clostridium botulinum]|uniref:Choline trimethylamine-lyase activating enzyme n=1 Tax=Clostridium botulinum (strain Okra / Type B1) TaxID=498213 RepID=B1IFU1_CLOBK|nr:choline TMA-lyase-activating enzyme [Clostridium botulinum]EKX79622.1 glycyl-radical enzyme activating protein family [Clostridium botulinum CFSAN001628]ACA44084.1 glycyl-radical enzyme activating family protein [Clostridium botulinum B1 str. Okra]MBD5563010.1 choline TMA-lyase-activating enzyme [Clostridium botulinum]MBD5566511.1 choline TMA-lyase-activating enzyme [Clostridium botulinum]MBD5568973.1 choline TMA-lyase-activating enzyme [Clostridium botulinum]